MLDDLEFKRENGDSECMIPSIMKRVWMEQLDMLKKVDAICKKYNITYFADWGTLLGTVRHHGYIPWDDDLDITMFREDYMRFLQVAGKELPKEYQVLNVYTNAEYTNLLTRITNSDAICISDAYLDQHHGCPYILGLDVFPIDYLAPTMEEDEVQRTLIKSILSVCQLMELNAISDMEKEACVAQIEENCGVSISRGKGQKQELYMLADRICALYSAEKNDRVEIMANHINWPRYSILREYYNHTIWMPFENVQMPVPSGYDALLKLKYGKDYMIPIKKWNSHTFPYFQDQERKLRDYLKEHPDEYSERLKELLKESIISNEDET